MNIPDKDIKLLWGRAANRCAICKVELSHDVEFSSAHYLLCEQAHIVAEHPDGPRGISVLTLKERNSYHNLILLCPTHHTIVDKNEQDYPIEKLHVIKSQHELWVQHKLEPDTKQNKLVRSNVSDLIEIIERLKAILRWIHTSVPGDQAEGYFMDLYHVWGYYNIANDFLELDFISALDPLIRPLSSGLIVRHQEYVVQKLKNVSVSISKMLISRSIKKVSEVVHLERRADEYIWRIEIDLRIAINEADKFTKNEVEVMRLMVALLQYYRKCLMSGDFVDVPSTITTSAIRALNPFFTSRLEVSLPEDIDETEIYRVKDLCQEAGYHKSLNFSEL